MHHPTSRSALPWIAGVLTLCSVSTPTVLLAGPQYGSEWSQNGIGAFVVVADMAPDPGLEALAVDPSASLHMIRLSDGHDLGAIPSPFSDFNQTVYYPRDVDGDGLAEIVCTFVQQYAPLPTIGCLEYDGGVVRKWPDVVDDTLGLDIQFMDISPDEPWAIVGSGNYLKIISSQDGSILYDSSLVLGSMSLLSAIVDDFDSDGYDEVLARFTNGVDIEADLIGDLLLPTAASQTTFNGVTLMQNRPNPMAGSTTIVFELPDVEPVRLRVFDTAGRLVRTLVDERMRAGRHQSAWNGKDDSGVPVATGIYFYELNVAGKATTRKLIRLQ